MKNLFLLIFFLMPLTYLVLRPAFIHQSNKNILDLDVTEQTQILFGAPKINGQRSLAKAYPNSLSMTILSDIPTPITKDQIFTLKVTISSGNEISNLQLRWSIPPELEIIGGPTGTVLSVAADQSVDEFITLKATSEANARIFAEAGYMRDKDRNNKFKHGTMVQFDTNSASLEPIFRRPFHRPNRERNKTHGGNEKIYE